MHNINVTATFNVLRVAADLGIDRVVLASSVNAIGLSMWWVCDELHVLRCVQSTRRSRRFTTCPSTKTIHVHPRTHTLSVKCTKRFILVDVG